MAKYLTKKRVVVLAIAALAVALGTGAFAYFTSTGSGTGTATVGSSSGVQLSSASVGPLYPGGADVPVTVTIHNPGGGSEYVNQVSGSVADNAGCLGSWFQVDSVSYAGTLAAGATDTKSTNVRMADSNTNQDVCQGKSMTINWSSN
jgi:ABC-type glycerol-3-phosphate transport system substrate-binding protein